MNVRHVPALLAYSPDKMRKVGLVDTPNLFCDAYCLEPGQEQTAHRHGVGDKLYYVVAGTGQIRVGNEEHAVAPGDLVCAEGRIYGARPEDRVYQGASLCFDLSVEEVWLAFRAGATLVAATQEMAVEVDRVVMLCVRAFDVLVLKLPSPP